MNLGVIAIIGILFVTLVVCVTVLVVVIRIFNMHDVRNADGQYAWMVPSSWFDIQEGLIRTQELMVAGLGELTVHNRQISKLLETQTNATLEMFEELRRMRGGAARDE